MKTYGNELRVIGADLEELKYSVLRLRTGDLGHWLLQGSRSLF